MSDRAWRLAFFGALALFIGGWLVGTSGVHSSTDNWIAVGTGRYIIETGKVPTTDPFSYTFQGQPFFNQNWLSHVAFYLLYEYVAPSAIVFFTWGMNLAIYGLVALATWLRARSWFAALLAAGTIAPCARHLYDTRPQTVSYVLFAILGLLFHYYLRPRARENLWLAGLMFPLLLIWSNAHGSFILAYVLVAAFVICWVATTGLRIPFLRRFEVPTTLRETAVFAVSAVLAFVLTVAFGPYGFSNFTHSFVVQESPLWKQVAEWNPPWVVAGAGLPTIGFWIALAIGGSALLGVVAFHVAVRRPAYRGESLMLLLSWGAISMAVFAMVIAIGTWKQVEPAIRDAQKTVGVKAFWLIVMSGIALLTAFCILRVAGTQPARERGAPDAKRPSPATFFDGALFLVGLYFALQSRRFAALFFVLSTPVLMHWLHGMVVQIEPMIQRIGRAALAGSGVCAGLVFMSLAARWAWADLVVDYRSKPEYNLLERYIMFDETNPVESFKFLKQLDEPFNIFAQWTVSGILFGRVPNARVFMDGRAQQVYSERHYILFNSFFFDQNPKRDWALRLLDETKTEFVVLRPTGEAQALLQAIMADSNWMPIITLQREALFVRRGSRAAQRLTELSREGRVTWPSSLASLVTQADLLLQATPPDPNQAVAVLKRATELDPPEGPKAYSALTRVWSRLGRQREGLAFFEAERQRVAALPLAPPDEHHRQTALNAIDQQIGQLRAPPPPPPPPQ